MTIDKMKKEWDMHLNRLCNLNDYAYEILKKIDNTQLKKEDTVVYMTFKRNIELIKGMQVLLNENLGSLADSLLRDLIEAYTHLIFITENKQQVNERALAYFYQHLKDSLKEMYTLKNLYKDDASSMNLILEEINILKSQQQSLELASIDLMWKKFEFENKKSPYYFSLFIKETSINKFVQRYSPKEVDEKLYGFTSAQVHGLNTVRDLHMLKEKGDISQLFYIRSDSKVLPNSLFLLAYGINAFINYFEISEEKYAERITEIFR